MSAEHRKPVALEYATPPPRRPVSLATVGAYVGILFALLGGYLLLVGVAGIVSLIQDWHQANSGDVERITICNLIGIVCCTVAVRWISAGFRRKRAARVVVS